MFLMSEVPLHAIWDGPAFSREAPSNFEGVCRWHREFSYKFVMRIVSKLVQKALLVNFVAAGLHSNAEMVSTGVLWLVIRHAKRVTRNEGHSPPSGPTVGLYLRA